MSFSKYSHIFQQVRNDQINEVAAILALQVAHERELHILQALSVLPEKFSSMQLSELDDESNLGSLAPSPEQNAALLSDWAQRRVSKHERRDEEQRHGEHEETKAEHKERKAKEGKFSGKLRVEVKTKEPKSGPDARGLVSKQDVKIGHEDDETRRVWIQVRALNTYGTLVAKRAMHINAPGAWGLPGGHPNVGEPAERAARRELREETGLRIKAGGLTAIGQVEHKGVEHFFFRVDYVNATEVYEAGLMTTEETTAYKFLRPALLTDLAKDKANGHKSIRRFVQWMTSEV